METSYHVFPGELWRPESANRFNSVSEMLNHIGVIGPSGPAQGNASAFSITCINRDKEKLSANTYVTISAPDMRPETDSSSAVYTMKRGFADPCGILLNDCDSGAAAEVQLYGIVEAVPPHPPHVFKLPGSKNNFGKELVLLNSIGCDPYQNYFKVIPEKFNSDGKILKVKIFDGANPASDAAGLTDVSEVKSASIDASGRYICLKLTGTTYAGTDTFKELSETFECLDHEPDENSPYVILAEIIDYGKGLVQRWTGGRVYWRNRFIVPHYGSF